MPRRLPAHRCRRERLLHHDQRLPVVPQRLLRARRSTRFSKAQLAAGAASVTMLHFDTSGMVNAPSDAGRRSRASRSGRLSRPGRSSTAGNGGTEYFLSSNAGDEAHAARSPATAGTRTSNQLVVWTLTNTVSLNTASPALSLSNKMLTVGQYGDPAEAAAARLGHGRPATTSRRATASTTRRRRRSPASAAGGCCSVREPAHNEVISRPDSNDTRMQQVMYANGKLWGALDTALNPDGGPAAGRHRLVRRQPERREDRATRATSERPATTSRTRPSA